MTDIPSISAQIQELENSYHWWNSWALMFTAGAAICATLAAVCAVGYFITSYITNRTSRQLNDAVKQESSLKEEQRRIEKEQSDREIARANAQASEANAIAEKLRKENLVLQADVLKLRTKMADRGLNTEQANAVARKVSAFAGQVFSVVTLAGEGEHRNLALRLISILQSKSAGWSYDNKNRGVLLAGAAGIFVDVAPTASAMTKKAGEILTSALVEEGLTAVMTIDSRNNTDPTTILIRVAGRL